MQIFFKLILIVATLSLVACNNSNTSNKSNTSNEVEPYQNKTLPTITDEAMPNILITSSLKKKRLRSIEKVSEGFIELKKNTLFFYQKQLEMNMDLGYTDSVWDQVETYCDGQDICNIPENKILFTYNKALYKRDMQLIEAYEEKTADKQSYEDVKEDLKELIGAQLKLSAAKLEIDEAAKYLYTFTTEDEDYEGSSIIKWNDKNENYLINEAMTQFEYIETATEKQSIFTSEDSFLNLEKITLTFSEKEGEIHFLETIPNSNDDLLSYHSEGQLSNTGGMITITGDGNAIKETFDAKGILLTRIKCAMSNNINDINDSSSYCMVQDSEFVKSFISKSIYTIFISNESLSMIKFDVNNTINAIQDCTTYTADYVIKATGIEFDNILKTVSPELKCVAHENEEKLEAFLKEGYEFGEDGFELSRDFFPILTNVGLASEFNLTAFNDKRESGKYVDAPLLNRVFSIKSSVNYSERETGEFYKFKTPPSIKVEGEKIMIDLLDATFDAEIEVVDTKHIKFTNINRIDKKNVTYPVDESTENCEEETENECIDDPYEKKTYSEKIFADIIEKFLNETITVESYSKEHVLLWGDELSFESSTLD